MRKHLILLASLALTATGVGTVLAQTSVDGLDLEGINRRAQAEATALSALIGHAIAQQAGSSDTSSEAQHTVDLARARLGEAAAKATKGPASPDSIDLDAMVAEAGKTTAPASRPAPQFIAFASLSMPEESLRQIIGDVSRAGGTIVFRGFAPQGAGAFMKGLSKAIPPGSQPRISVDPRLFEAFHVASVPTYIAVADGFVPCAGGACTASPQVFDRLSGNVSTAFALETIADGDGPGAPVARSALLALKGEP
jgi:conjugal transfer pilus assembly protein TrbC